MDPELERLDRLLEEAFGRPPGPPKPPPVTARSLDRILGSRTHVRVLRVLVALSTDLNLSARAVARMAIASPARVRETLEQLISTGIVIAHRAPTHSIYSLNDEHPLGPATRALFDAERQAAP